MSKSYALLWFYDIFFCHQNLLEMDKEKKDYAAAQEEMDKEDWDKKWPDEDWIDLLEHFTTDYTKDYRPIFAKKCRKTRREIRLYEAQIKTYQAWNKAGQTNATTQPWYFALLDLFSDLFDKKTINEKDFLTFYGLNERTFKRYIHTIRAYEKGKGRNEFAVQYDAKAKVYRSIPTGLPSPVNKNTGFKGW